MPAVLSTEQILLLDDDSLAIDIPSECELPEELRSIAPRRIPDQLYRCKRIRVPFLMSWIAIGVFVASVAAGATPIGEPWARIAFWSVAIVGLVGTVGVLTSRRELRYVQDGVVGAGRILELRLVPAARYNGQTIALKHVVSLELVLSDGSAAVHEFTGLQIKADGGRQADLRMGDLLPIVWLPGQFRKTAQIYAFLSFNQDKVLTRKTGEASSLWQKAGQALAVVAILAVLVGNLLLLMWCEPVAMNVPVVVTIGVVGALVLGGATLAAIVREFKRENLRAALRNQRAISEGHAIQEGASHVFLTNTPIGWLYRIVVVAGSLLIGGLTMVLWSFGANQFLDQAPPVGRVIEILGVEQVGGKSPRTKVTFRPVDEPQGKYSKEYAGRDLPRIPLVVGQQAQVDWHPGAFGWPWIGEMRAMRGN